jgi:hypothetical protein
MIRRANKHMRIGGKCFTRGCVVVRRRGLCVAGSLVGAYLRIWKLQGARVQASSETGHEMKANADVTWADSVASWLALLTATDSLHCLLIR